MRPNTHLILLAVVLATVGRMDAGEAHSGIVALGEMNCTACHAPSETQKAWITPKAAPRLTNLGSRVSPEWLQSYLADPQKLKPGTTMPDLLHGNPEQAEALTHFLMSGGSQEFHSTLDEAAVARGDSLYFRRVMPDKAAVARGDSLYHRVGCVACHSPQNGTIAPVDSVAFPELEQKWSVPGLKKFLLDPLATRPSGRMPSMHLTDREAGDLAHYLLRKTNLPAPAEVAFFTHRPRSFDALDTAEITRTAPANGFTLEVPMKVPGATFRITTWLTIKERGEYTFFLKATGASRLSIAGRWSIGEDSWRSGTADGKYDLDFAPGCYELKLDFSQRGKSEPALAVEWQGPGFERSAIPVALLNKERAPTTPVMAEIPKFKLDPEKAKLGRQLFDSLNCATCHEGKSPAKPLPNLATVNPTRGCLADEKSPSAPHFYFDSKQRESLRQEISTPRPNSPTPPERLAHTLASFRCLSCHVRDDAGGVTPERDAFFTSNVDDLGDQGRIPPTLDGVGDKLRPEWLEKVLTEGSGVRPYLNTRMPRFGASNVGHLTDIFVMLDHQAQPIAPVTDAPDVQREVGRKLIGTDGLSCVACHRFNRQPAHSMQVVDLAYLTEHLNEDWLRRFLRDPNKFQPGTRMPALWPNGQSLFPALLDGDTDRQHAAIWTYLSDGAKAKFPEGLSRKNLEIVVGGEAVVYRGKLWEAGFRGIATGHPGALNTAFDSEEMRLAYLWRGRFLDASPHWSNQGMGRIRPLGSDVTPLAQGSPFAVLADKNSPWPAETSKELGMKFSGYQLDTLKRPTFLYSFRGTTVEDFISATDGSSFCRTIKLTSPGITGLHFRVATGKIIATGENAWRLNDQLTLKLPSGSNAFVRGKDEQMELLLPVSASGEKPQLEINYVW